METPQCPLPWGKVVLIDTVEDAGEIIPIRHTLDQVKSVPKFIFAPGGIVQKELALVSNAEHFPRIWRYFNKWVKLPKGVTLVTFTIPTRESEDIYEEKETTRVISYAEQGHLTYNPISHDQKFA